MSGLHKQSKTKKIKRSVQMGDEVAPTAAWERPPSAECEESPGYPMTPDGGDPSKDRIVVAYTNEIVSGDLVGFAIIQHVHWAGDWREVVVIDSAHDAEVHLHQYVRSTCDRTGEAEPLMAIAEKADVQRGYDVAITRILADWATYKRRWHDG